MNYRLLGKSGLRVSEFCLGTMTFGDDWGWGSSKDDAKKSMTLFGKWAATSLIPPTSTRMARVSPFSASFSKDIAKCGSRDKIYKCGSRHGPKRSGQSPQEHGASGRGESQAASD